MPEIEVDDDVAKALEYGLGDELQTKNELLWELMHQRGWIQAAERTNNTD